ncbi:MAG: hypothetical protein AMDU4_FER2C00006G0028 [Ferroplasma sp. Type II]|jgi:hypothetical protein|nr:MAG: hypothetical protein AMDU4_FER2C00006G0028 [Ferroplasma sp. Type II]
MEPADLEIMNTRKNEKLKRLVGDQALVIDE